MTDVLICGAGPTGLALAIELARRGIEARVIERELMPPTNPRAFVLKPSTLIAAERMGFLERLLEEGIRVDAMSYFFEGRVIATATSPSERWPWHLNLGEDRLIPILTSRLESLGVVIERGIELTAFEEMPDGVRIELKNRAGRTEKLKTGWLAGCDGIHSSIREKAGIAFNGHERSLHWHVLDAQIEGWPYKESHGVLFFESLIVSVYRTKEVFRVYSASFEPSKESWSRVRDFLKKHVPSAKLGPALNDTAFHSKSKLSACFRSGRIVLAGDAAHAMSPSGGLGLNSGVQDALNVGWKLSAVIKGQAEEALLDTYDLERRAAAQAALTVSQGNDDLFSVADPAVRARSFRKFGVKMVHYLRGGGSGYEAVMGPYERSIVASGSEPDFGPGPGVHFPSDIQVARADGQLCYLTGELGTHSHNLVIFIADGGIEAKLLVESAIGLCSAYAEEITLTVVARSIEGVAARTALGAEGVTLLIDQEMTAHNLLGVVERCAMWVRPDGWIGARHDDAANVEALKGDLQDALPNLF
ncbi:FAD-dependent monooxygenase [Roseibium sp. SCP14]|uniref:FAD-dependent monooxygenase n=1 Tax=Roseibium sp. SCP14 TaxID=3141375 RepID=UPI003335EA56